jgi:hypothetical protein
VIDFFLKHVYSNPPVIVYVLRFGTDEAVTNRRSDAMNAITIFILALCVSFAAVAQTTVQSSTQTSAQPSSSSNNNNGGMPVRTGESNPNTIFKHVDENGRVTYTNYPVKGGTKLDIDLVTVVPTNGKSLPAPVVASAAPASGKSASIQPAAAAGSTAAITVPAVDKQTQTKRDDMRRRILEQELQQEQTQLTTVKTKLTEEERTADSLKLLISQLGAGKSTDATKQQAQTADRIAQLKVALNDHERNLTAIQKELGALR